MSNCLKAGRVAQVFGVQLQNRIHWEQFHFLFSLTVVCFYTDFSFYHFKVNGLGLVTFLWLCFQMNLDDYPHFILTEDGRPCSTVQHSPGFP
jgi:hypothetical protein